MIIGESTCGVYGCVCVCVYLYYVCVAPALVDKSMQSL